MSTLETQWLSTGQAARELEVSQHQVAMLVAHGEINAARAGSSLLVDPYSLRLYKQLRCGRGRPLGAEVAWAALWLLSGLDAPWLSYQPRRRLFAKLKKTNAAELAWQTRKRAVLRVFRVERERFAELAGQLTLSGKSTDRPDIFGMPPNRHELEGYTRGQDLEALAGEYGMNEDISGNVLVHVPAARPWIPYEDSATGHTQMPVAVVAADLASSLDPREAHAGLAALDILLGGFQRL